MRAARADSGTALQLSHSNLKLHQLCILHTSSLSFYSSKPRDQQLAGHRLLFAQTSSERECRADRCCVRTWSAFSAFGHKPALRDRALRALGAFLSAPDSFHQIVARTANGQRTLAIGLAATSRVASFSNFAIALLPARSWKNEI